MRPHSDRLSTPRRINPNQKTAGQSIERAPIPVEIGADSENLFSFVAGGFEGSETLWNKLGRFEWLQVAYEKVIQLTPTQ